MADGFSDLEETVIAILVRGRDSAARVIEDMTEIIGLCRADSDLQIAALRKAVDLIYFEGGLDTLPTMAPLQVKRMRAIALEALQGTEKQEEATVPCPICLPPDVECTRCNGTRRVPKKRACDHSGACVENEIGSGHHCTRCGAEV